MSQCCEHKAWRIFAWLLQEVPGAPPPTHMSDLVSIATHAPTLDLYLHHPRVRPDKMVRYLCSEDRFQEIDESALSRLSDATLIHVGHSTIRSLLSRWQQGGQVYDPAVALLRRLAALRPGLLPDNLMYWYRIIPGDNATANMLGQVLLPLMPQINEPLFIELVEHGYTVFPDHIVKGTDWSSVNSGVVLVRHIEVLLQHNFSAFQTWALGSTEGTINIQRMSMGFQDLFRRYSQVRSRVLRVPVADDDGGGPPSPTRPRLEPPPPPPRVARLDDLRHILDLNGAYEAL